LQIRAGAILLFAAVAAAQIQTQTQLPANPSVPSSMLGFPNYSAESKWDQKFLKVPDATLAGEELKTLTAAPHVASSPEDHATALYVAEKFRAAGLETKIVPYRVMLNFPKEIRVTAYGADGKQIMSGPTPEHVKGDPFENDPRIVTAFNSSSPSGDVTAEVVYANYGRPQDFQVLADKHIDVRGKIILVRYGANFRGVKVYVAQLHGAAGVLIYSDPADDGYFRGDPYPMGPFRPDTGVQRGAVQYLFEYPGDPTTPGIASTLDLPASQRIALSKAASQPKIPSTPLSYHDAAPILEHLGGPESPRSWQGALPFTYHMGPGPVKVHMLLKQDYALRTIWDVIGKVPGTETPDAWVVAGNHRDAWVFGAVDPNSGTAAMLEAVHGIGDLLHQGWKPKRTILFASWDAEEEGLIGSTEWVEQHAVPLQHAVAYFNMDVGVAGPNFEAESVPSLKPFILSVTKLVSSPQGGTVYDVWKRTQQEDEGHSVNNGFNEIRSHAIVPQDVRIGDLGSGSDYTPFLQHVGVPSTDIGSDGPYGVYHSAFDDYTWFTRFADPHFVYLQQQARVFGLEVLHMADAEVLPYDYALYGSEIISYLETAQRKATAAGLSTLDFAPAIRAAERFRKAGADTMVLQQNPTGNVAQLNTALRATETDLLSAAGLPNRPWFKHTIYAPGEFTGYAAVVIPGVNEAIDAKNVARASHQMDMLTQALNNAAATLESIH
jgi:N-acetylated-alpha-linked acidic dipeptidase